MVRLLKFVAAATALTILAGCGAIRPFRDINTGDHDPAGPQSVPQLVSPANKVFEAVPAPEGPPVIVAVYGFKDVTGQRKPSATLSQFSSAVTQGADAYLIKSLHDIGNRQWFTVVERVGLDNLLKERQMIRQTREVYDGANAKLLPPMLLAGVIIEGGIIDYNSNTLTGGSGARWLGIGPYTQYTNDVVVINLRMVSVQTGEVITSITVQKNLLSTAEGVTALRFFNQATRAFELDMSQTYNEPTNYALRSAIEQGVVELIMQGERQGLWKFKQIKKEQEKK